MRFINEDKTGCYCDAVAHRVEKTKDGKEVAMCDLSLRIQPLAAAMAEAIDPRVRLALFRMDDGVEKPEVKAITFNIAVPRQQLAIYLLPEWSEPQIALSDVEITGIRARTEKGVTGFGFCFDASFGPASKVELEYVVAWLTQQRFVTFQPQQPALDFANAPESEAAAEPPRRRRAFGTPAPAQADQGA